MLFRSILKYRCSTAISNLQTLYQQSKLTKTPFFTMQSHHIQIIDDPLDFYMQLYKCIGQAIHRISISSLYLGTGSLERFLLNSMVKRVANVPSLQVNMLFDYNRSQRVENGESSIQMMQNYLNQKVKNRFNVAFHRQSSGPFGSVLGQISGVHHQKMAIFDDTVLIGGANLSHNYFVNRRDRYMAIRSNGELCDYLHDYLISVSQDCHQLSLTDKIQMPTSPNMQQHYKMWKYAYTPSEYKDTLHEQQKYLQKIQEQKSSEMKRTVQGEVKKPIPQNRNVILAEMLGTDVKVYEEVQERERVQRRERVREKLFNVGDENDVGNHLMDIQNIKTDQDVSEVGEKVYIFPFMQHPQLKETKEPEVLKAVLNNSVKQKIPVRISSGYMNFTNQILNQLGKGTVPTEVLCSAPEANSFYRGGTFKQFIPYFYRNFQGMILQKWPQKFRIKQYFDGKWSFHAKGMWLKQNDNNYLTVLGSSNFNHRSKARDTELQLYLYSTCEKFNYRLDKQWNNIDEHCKEVKLQDIQKDPEIKYNFVFRVLSKLFSRFL